MDRTSIPTRRAPRARTVLAGAGALAVLAAAATLAPAGAALAGPWVIDCPTGCLLQPDVDGDGNPLPVTQFGDDYTVPPDGRTYEWTFRLRSDDPAATVFLDFPNETFGNLFFGGGGQGADPNPPFLFQENVAPLLTTIMVRTGANYFHCTPATPIGQLCGETFDIFGNATRLTLNSSLPATLFTSATMLPEPAAWTLLIAGFGAAGARLRRSRRPALPPPPHAS
jgi:hypothetical protein